MIFRVDDNTIIEINKNSFINDKEYYKYLMKNASCDSPKLIKSKQQTEKKNVISIKKNDENFIKKYLL